MANITRYDPFNDLDDLFKGLFVRPMRFDLDVAPQMRMKIDVTKTDDGYTVKADIPGVSKDDIQVSIDGNEVTISGEIKKESEQKKGEEVLAASATTARYRAASRCRTTWTRRRWWRSTPTVYSSSRSR